MAWMWQTAEFLFAVARWGQRNTWNGTAWVLGTPVSIRCREMGTAERGDWITDEQAAPILAARGDDT